ncbi:hypothetical protein H920_05331 [Fukomys damarensis]|uniref:Uncharacterized protein n=1 Tax=Fukomys damarensis TaxID=885580 RepID=A0A091DRQ5_FUKDA|nr:hypothetical protein H920_05331 [Fukomys damarensis]
MTSIINISGPQLRQSENCKEKTSISMKRTLHEIRRPTRLKLCPFHCHLELLQLVIISLLNKSDPPLTIDLDTNGPLALQTSVDANTFQKQLTRLLDTVTVMLLYPTVHEGCRIWYTPELSLSHPIITGENPKVIEKNGNKDNKSPRPFVRTDDTVRRRMSEFPNPFRFACSNFMTTWRLGFFKELLKQPIIFDFSQLFLSHYRHPKSRPLRGCPSEAVVIAPT